MEAKLVVAKGKTSVKEIPLNGVSTIIGRRHDCALCIPSPLVSRQHCELTRAGSRMLVKDLGSSNGTFVNGAKIKQKELKSGDTLGVGPITFIVQLGGAPVSPSDTARPALAGAVADDAADFVVSEDVVAEEAAEFVPGVEVTAEDTGEAADFVVGEEVAAEAVEEEGADFVVAAEADTDTETAEVSDFVVADEAGAEAETVHDANIADFVAEEATPDSGQPVAEADPVSEAEPAEAEEEAPISEQPKKKVGFFGRLFKKKDKKPAPTAASPAEPGKATAVTPGPQPAVPATPTSPTAAAGESEAAEFFVTEDEGQAAPAKPVGEDELADFLMGLNEKDQ